MLPRAGQPAAAFASQRRAITELLSRSPALMIRPARDERSGRHRPSDQTASCMLHGMITPPTLSNLIDRLTAAGPGEAKARSRQSWFPLTSRFLPNHSGRLWFIRFWISTVRTVLSTAAYIVLGWTGHNLG